MVGPKCTPDVQAEILALHFGQKKGTRAIARILGINRKAVRRVVEKRQVNLSRDGVCSDEPVGLKDYREFLSTLRTLLTFSDSVEFKSKLVKWLVAKIEVLPTSFRMHFYVGKNQIIPVKWEQEKAQSVAKSGGSKGGSDYPIGKA